MKALLASTSAIVYVHYVLIEGRTKWEHDKKVGIMIKKLKEAGMHVNADKIQLWKEKVLFLGYDVLAGEFSLNTYVQEQKEKLPGVSSKSEIRRVLGVLNLCRGSFLDLDKWV